MQKHKTFISFHHEDEYYKNQMERLAGYQFVSKSVREGDIDPDRLQTETIRQKIRDDFIGDATVTVVLVGPGTWRRKHVDWEIGSSIRHTQRSPRNGLLGILLPNYPLVDGKYNPRTIPPRLYDNIQCGFAKIYAWNGSFSNLGSWIHDAFQRRLQNPPPDNSRDGFKINLPDSQSHWTD